MSILITNHRDLVLSSRRKPKFHFLSLPFDLQDHVIDGLDRNQLTLYEAQVLIKERGFELSHAAIADYCGAVRKRRAEILSGLKEVQE